MRPVENVLTVHSDVINAYEKEQPHNDNHSNVNITKENMENS